MTNTTWDENSHPILRPRYEAMFNMCLPQSILKHTIISWPTVIECASLIPRPFPPPVFDHFQYEIRRGKAWEIWSRAVPSGCTLRAVPDEEYQCPVLYIPSKCWKSECSQGSELYQSLFTMPLTDRCKTGHIYMVGHRQCVYQLST